MNKRQIALGLLLIVIIVLWLWFFYTGYRHAQRVAIAAQQYCWPDNFGSGMNTELYATNIMKQHRYDFLRGKVGRDERDKFLPQGFLRLCSWFWITDTDLYLEDKKIMPYNDSLNIIWWNLVAQDDTVYYINTFEGYVAMPLSGARADDVEFVSWYIMWEDGQEYGNAYLVSNRNYYFKDKLIEWAKVVEKK